MQILKDVGANIKRLKEDYDKRVEKQRKKN
jgi:hypothetical protein